VAFPADLNVTKLEGICEAATHALSLGIKIGCQNIHSSYSSGLPDSFNHSIAEASTRCVGIALTEIGFVE
jgi:hypothetical protein